MQLWNFVRPFKFRGHDHAVKVSLTFSKITSCLYWEDKLVDEQSMNHTDGSTTFVHSLKTLAGSEAHVESGYISWWSNIGIAVIEDEQVIYESHPGKDIRYGEKVFKQMIGNNPDIRNTQKDKWEKNKYSVYADLALGALFFIAGKITGDLTLAAMLGVAGGLSLILLQRFMKVDLLGGFAVFGTIMLLISGIFSLFLQDDYWVQMKGTVLGLLTASVFFLDGVLRQGAYFGARIERYMPVTLHHNRLAIGVSLTGVFNALGNYLVAENFSGDFWLTYTTFLDTPLLVILMLFVLRWSRKT
jgi:intracellular septation protein A